MLYGLARRLTRLLLTVFYRRIHVADVERVPATGALVLVANHHNALVDPLLLLATMPRRLVPIAKAPLFVHPVMGPLLRAVGAIPVARRQDGGPGARPDPSRNAAMFARAREVLGGGGAILIFPEGVSQPDPIIMPLRTGAARILLDAAGDAPAADRLALVPVGLVYDDPAAFRGGEALVQVGPAIDTRDVSAGAPLDPEGAVRALTDRIAAALRALIVEARDRETRELLRVAETLHDQEAEIGLADRAAWRRRALAALTGEDGAGRVEALRRDLHDHARDLARAGLGGADLAGSYPARAVARYVVREGWALLVALPAALWGMLTHALPYQLTGLVVRALRPETDVAATFKLGVGLLLYPLCWLGEGWLVWRAGGPWLLALFCAGLVPAGLIALTWQERLERVQRQARGFLQFLAHRDGHGHLVARRRALVHELSALMASDTGQTAGPGPLVKGPG